MTLSVHMCVRACVRPDGEPAGSRSPHGPDSGLRQPGEDLLA